jgi:O-antigen/teichoic acid export membrane protein
MQQGKKIILNTLASYGQSVISIVLSLFSVRWILQGLGQTDFGLFSVVGSLTLLITFLSGGLSVGVSRFYAYSIGESSKETKDIPEDDLKRWFNTAFSLHLVVPFLLIGIGWPIGDYAIRNWLTIPVDRIDTCLWVFRFSLVGTFFGVLAVPFISMYRAHQLIFELAAFGVLRVIGVFVLSWSLLHVSADRLIFYAGGMMAISVIIQLLQITRACVKFDSCRVKVSYMYNPTYMKNLFGFVGWKMFGMSCVAFRGQGAPVLINLFYGPLVNAAFSIANRLSMQATTLSTAMTQAFLPAVISAEGMGDRKKVISMSIQASKFGALLVSFFAIPLILEMQLVLNLWLGEAPAYAAQLCQAMVAMLILDRVTSGPMLAVNAYGKIAMYELIQGTLLFSVLPLMWVFHSLGFGPNSVAYALIVSMSAYCVGRLVFAKRLLAISYYQSVLRVPQR